MDEFTYALFSTPFNTKLISELQNQKVFIIPNVETQKIDLNNDCKNILLNNAKCDWIIFTDIFTVDYFIAFLEENNFNLYDLDEIRICAFGEAVADRLRFSAIHSDLIAVSVEDEKVFKLLKDFLAGDNFSKLEFLILKESTNVIKLTNLIKSANSKITEISIYKMLEKENSEITKIKALILGGAIDEFVFSDPADLIGFKKYFFHLNNQNVFSEIKFSVLNEVMFQMLLENGLKPIYFEQKK